MHIVSPASAALEGAVLRPAAVPQHKQLPVFAPLPSACDDGQAEDDVVYPGAGSGPIVVIARPRTAAVVAPGTSRTMLPVALNATARNTVGDIRALVATQLPGSPSPAAVRLFRVQPTATQHPDPAVASASRVDYGATLSVSNGSFGARTRASSVSSCNAGPASDVPSGAAAPAHRATMELRSDGDSIADVLASNNTTQSAREKITLAFDVDGRTVKTARATGTATSLATSAASSVSSVPCRPASAFAPPVRPRGYSGVRAVLPQ